MVGPEKESDQFRMATGILGEIKSGKIVGGCVSTGTDGGGDCFAREKRPGKTHSGRTTIR